MTYRIEGLDPARFAHLVGLGDVELARWGAVRLQVDAPTGFPCRVKLADLEPGSAMLLLNHVSHDGPGPYRSAHAIFVGEQSLAAGCFSDATPPCFEGRILSLRAFDRDGMMHDAALAGPGEADSAIRRLLADPNVDHVDAHYALRGCFAARIERF